MIFSLFSMVLLHNWQETISGSQSNLEKKNAEALQTTLYKGGEVPEALCTAILHNRQAVSKIKRHFITIATPVAQAEIVPTSPKRERSMSGSPDEIHETPAQAIPFNM